MNEHFPEIFSFCVEELCHHEREIEGGFKQIVVIYPKANKQYSNIKTNKFL